MNECRVGQLSVSQKVVRNTAYNIAGRIWGILVAVFLTPYIIARVGVEGYGIWAVVGVLTGYFGLLDFGISTSFVKYIAEFYSKKEFEKINQVVNAGFFFYSVFGVVIVTFSFIYIEPLVAFFKIPPALYRETIFVFLLGIFLFVASNALSPFVAIQSGLQRMDISNKIAIVISLPTVFGTIFFLEKGWGLSGLMINNVIIFVLSSSLSIVSAFRILPELKFNPFASFNKEIIRKLFYFGYRMQLTKISGVVTSQTDKLLLVYLLSVNLVTFYQLGSSIISYAVSVSTLLISALMPAFTELESRGDLSVLVDAYLRSVKYLVFVAMPLFIFLIVTASKLVFIWVGMGYSKAVLVTQILAIAFLLNTIAQVAASACLAIDKPQFMATASGVIVFLNIVLSFVLIKAFGFYGAAWGTAIATNIGTGYFVILVHRAIGVSSRKLFLLLSPCLIAGILSAALVIGIDVAITAVHVSLSRFSALVVFGLQAVVFSAVYFLVIYYTKLFDNEDLRLFREKIPIVNQLMKHHFFNHECRKSCL